MSMERTQIWYRSSLLPQSRHQGVYMDYTQGTGRSERWLVRCSPVCLSVCLSVCICLSSSLFIASTALWKFGIFLHKFCLNGDFVSVCWCCCYFCCCCCCCCCCFVAQVPLSDWIHVKKTNFTVVHSSYINFNTASEKFWQATGESNLAYKSWPQQKLLKFSFCKHPTVVWPVEQSSNLSAKFDCPVSLLWRRTNARNVSQHTLYGIQHIHINLKLIHRMFYCHADAD